MPLWQLMRGLGMPCVMWQKNITTWDPPHSLTSSQWVDPFPLPPRPLPAVQPSFLLPYSDSNCRYTSLQVPSAGLPPSAGLTAPPVYSKIKTNLLVMALYTGIHVDSNRFKAAQTNGATRPRTTRESDRNSAGFLILWDCRGPCLQTAISFFPAGRTSCRVSHFSIILL